MSSRKITSRLGVAAIGVVLATNVSIGRTPQQSAVVDWYQIGFTTANAVGQPGAPQTRSLAIVAVSINDAVNAVTREFPRYASTLAPPVGASPVAAAIGAGYRSLTRLYPTQAGPLALALLQSTTKYQISASDPGLEFGESVADDILVMRSTDGFAQAQFPYTAPNAGAPGVWQPTPPGFLPAALPGLGAVRPWVLNSGAQFRPDEGPDLTSARYAEDFNEIKAVGALTSTTRTAEQTNIAEFWLTTPNAIWGSVLGQVAIGLELDESETARDFALMSMAGSDAAIACWDTKYTFNFWRPIDAIRRAAEDDNPATDPDPGWLPLATTPNFPEFTSGHTTVSSAMATVLRLLFDDDPGVPLTVTSATNPGFVRHWDSFSQGVNEVTDARVYAGIHFRHSDEVGVKMGEQVGRFVFHHTLRRH
jgi:hypothetical protein